MPITDLATNVILDNVGKVYFLKTGVYRDPVGLDNNHPLSSVSAMLIHIEDGVPQNVMLANYAPSKLASWASHDFPLWYRGQVEYTIAVESAPRTFAQYFTYVPSILVAMNKNGASVMDVNVTLTQNTGANLLGGFADLATLISEYPPTELLSDDVSTAYVYDSAVKGFYNVTYNTGTSVWEWELVDQALVTYGVQTKQYNVLPIKVQRGFAPNQAPLSVTDEVIRLIYQEIAYINALLVSHTDLIEDLDADIIAHLADLNNPHQVTALQTAYDNAVSLLVATTTQGAIDEIVANKVEAFQVTPDDTHYPSEKLVKDSLDLKEDEANKVTAFQVTPSDTAYPSEKLVKDQLDLKEDLANKATTWGTPDDTKYPTTKLVDDRLDPIELFMGDEESRLQEIEGDIDDIESGTTEIPTYELKTNKVTAFSLPTDTQYPSAKLTKDQLDLKEDKANKGQAGGYPDLDESGKVPLAQMYGTLNDLQDVYIVGSTPLAVDWLSLTVGGSALTPESGNWYHVVTVGDYQGESYRWSGSAYVLVSSDLILGETSNTAYRGDRGKTAYDHSQLATGSNPHATTFANLVSKPTDIAGYGITDAYDKDYIDALVDLNGWQSTLLTPTPLTNGQTVLTATLASYDKLTFICRNTSTGELDSDEMVGAVMVNGNDLVFFDTAGTNLMIGGTNAVFATAGTFELIIYGFVISQQVAENIAVTHSGTAFLDASDDVKQDVEILDGVIKENADMLLATRQDVGEHEVRIDTIEESMRKTGDDEVNTLYGTENISLGVDVAKGPVKVLIDGGLLDAPQLVTNGDLTSTTSWDKAGTATYSVSSGIMTFLAAAQYQTVRQLATLTVGSKYYWASKVKATSNAVYAGLFVPGGATTDVKQHSGSSNYELLSSVYLYSSEISGIAIGIWDARASGWDNIFIDYIYRFNISTLISNKQYSPISRTTFDLMTDAAIKTQMDAWVLDGTLPNSIQAVNFNKSLTAVGKNLFDGQLELGSIDANGNIIVNTATIRSINYIKIKPSTTYIISNNKSYSFNMYYYDINYVFISLFGGTAFTTPANAYYVKFRTGTNQNDLTALVQLELGSVATTYEPYISTKMFINGVTDGYKLPNQIRDTIEQRNGKLYRVQRLETANPTGVVAVNTTNYTSAKTGGQFINYLTAGGSEIGVIGTNSTSGAGFLVYELATPIETEIEATGSITALPNGTIYVQDEIAVLDIYGTDITVEDADYPIKTLTKIIHVNTEGLSVVLPISGATVAGDGLSFTHTDLSAGDVVYFEYLYTGVHLKSLVTTSVYTAQDDWKFPINQLRQGATAKPTFDYTNIGYLMPQNDETEILYGSDQKPHIMVVDSPITPHVHVILTQAGSPSIKFAYRFTNIGSLESGTFTTVTMAVQSSAWASGRLHVMLYNATPISTVGVTDSSVLDFKIYRTTGDGYTGNLLLKSVDIHFFKKRVG